MKECITSHRLRDIIRIHFLSDVLVHFAVHREDQYFELQSIHETFEIVQMIDVTIVGSWGRQSYIS